MKTINLEENMPTVIDAMDNLKQSIALAKATKTKVMVIIHGYGSSGRGGAICKSARQWLKAQERNGKFKTVIFGENFDLFKKVYGAPSLKAAQNEFEKFKQVWSMYPGAVEVWSRNFEYVAQLFDYGSAIRKIMYTTNAVESVNSSFRKVTKQGAFPNENALLKLLYLRITELYRKWEKGTGVQNWSIVRNQLTVNEKFKNRILKYENLV